MSRLAGLEGVVAIPVLIFTINNGKNSRSKLVIDALGACAPKSMSCIELEDEDALRAYLERNQIPAREVLRLEDAPHRKGFLKYTYHGTVDAGAPRPLVLFSAHIGRDVANDARVKVVANQLLGDFSRNFLQRIDAGLLPWGTPKTKRLSTRRGGLSRFFGDPRSQRNKSSRDPASDDPPLTMIADGAW